MKPAILFIGRTGQLGRELSRLLPRLGAVTSLDRQQLDLTKSEDIRRAICKFRPNLIVNAASYTAVDQAESDPDVARSVNAGAPAVMSEEAKQIGACLVHYSTDYVFDGSKTEPYKEQDLTNPQNVYGQTKLEGEIAIQESGVPHLIFRTSWVYATEGRNFLLTMLRLMTQREELRIVSDQVGAPTLNTEIAEATTKILSQLCSQGNCAISMSKVTGIYHMTAAGETTWFDFAEAIWQEARTIEPRTPWFAAATSNLPLITRRILPIRTSEYPTSARRPAYSVLSNERLVRTFSVQLRHWREQLHSILTNHPMRDR
jgi:dTDP-4-dehydrorhamnose reductase